jgi:RNA polymerase sigma factor (sigma-70 family)
MKSLEKLSKPIVKPEIDPDDFFELAELQLAEFDESDSSISSPIPEEKFIDNFNPRFTSDMIEQVLLKTKHFGILTREQEYEIGERRDNGNLQERETAIQDLMNHNYRLVVKLIRKNTSNIDQEDLFQEGCIGLRRAAEDFDHKKGYKFSTYAAWWIKHFVGKSVLNDSRTIRLPVWVTDKIQKMEKGIYKREQELGRELTAEELAREFPRANELFLASRTPVSLDEIVLAKDEKTEKSSSMSDHDVSVEDQAINAIYGEQILDFLDETLSEKEAEILKQLFGLGVEEKTAKELMLIYNVSRTGVDQIRDRAFRKLINSPKFEKIIGRKYEVKSETNS